jgi:hypothetical protein
VVLGVVVIILIGLASGIIVRGNFWLYPILISTVLGVSLTQGLPAGLNLLLAAVGGLTGGLATAVSGGPLS